MKKLMFICILLISLGGFPMDTVLSIQTEISVKNGIKNGKYNSIVNYYNASTGHREKYISDVNVKNDRVVAISLPKRGSVRSGYNKSGYFYRGGSLNFERDFEGNIIAATTKVTVSDSDGYRYFKIRIEIE